ncbi:mitochondrial FAD-linked sulfhydryl oxidase-like protein ERV1 [Dendryphion nanum]|uniref:Sulfhydryl oxidase n=1 Tax=Dendryphion nanum TaxID=256645 RepID=A0A9P9D7M3_9PLEO|nr:mitochondrial FAD-linked sulfhydryl oxidase-like protein ERV1 [Dendryphion nanum]
MAPGPIDQTAESQTEAPPAKLPPGVVLGPDGKPYAWSSMAMKNPSASKPLVAPPPIPTTDASTDCPPDVEVLGRSSWTLLHSITATYPTNPSPQLQSETKSFMHIFSKLYPCWHCASDFQTWLREEKNAPRVSSRDEFGRWMCEAHNAVNVKLGKNEFDCNKWEERWRTGWKDGRCD